MNCNHQTPSLSHVTVPLSYYNSFYKSSVCAKDKWCPIITQAENFFLVIYINGFSLVNKPFPTMVTLVFLTVCYWWQNNNLNFYTNPLFLWCSVIRLTTFKYYFWALIVCFRDIPCTLYIVYNVYLSCKKWYHIDKIWAEKALDDAPEVRYNWPYNPCPWPSPSA
jgi:hypothetical protein